ncbi:hypothetical protein A0128_20095 [Leptospira tipperaryensis]|uniref:Uncharacterized protein n=1 Tax=Leptospira tipperaryensis TaxID=2564040 RepID=A0A1D7V3D3_9LEPT|nr:hypothetical protein [Leptospira tipperaryensis]AOP36323.1 hypothetical protein A0128_20095 [Leptospira tipperaryensis]
MKKTKKDLPSYDLICFGDLAYEFDSSEKKKIEKKIRRRLKYYALGEFDPDRVEYIRKLKDELREEFRNYQSSKYYKGATGMYSDTKDFDFESFLHEYQAMFPKILPDEMARILHFSIYLYYLR